MPRSRRRLLADAAGVAGCLAIGALLLRTGDAGWARPGSEPALSWPVDAAVGTVGSLLLWYRRRHPLLVALLLIPAGAVAGSVTPALAVSVFALAVRRGAGPAVPVAAADIGSVLVYFALQPDPRHPLAVDLVVRGGIVAGALGWGLFAGAQGRLVASLRERAARLESEQRLRVEQARLTERTRIAREMHDVLAHRLSLVSLHAGALELRTDASPEEVSSAAGVIRTNAHEALGELRAVIGVLRDTSAFRDGERPQPTLADIPGLVAAAGAGYESALPEGERPDVTVGRTVYRIVQEGLTNARKHAAGTAAKVHVWGTPADGVRVEVTNPLSAPASSVPGSGTGLIGLAERVELAGGRLAHGVAGFEFRLTAWLPWVSGGG
ncbi:sensor histidine kinase [Dactylosporangium sp. McL0621]|uniref:sensor histidine kinase n=1 Tax=Dactylosporangium sp. McL0621 TaxID=3415678 RepID=UPI003CF45850